MFPRKKNLLLTGTVCLVEFKTVMSIVIYHVNLVRKAVWFGRRPGLKIKTSADLQLSPPARKQKYWLVFNGGRSIRPLQFWDNILISRLHLGKHFRPGYLETRMWWTQYRRKFNNIWRSASLFTQHEFTVWGRVRLRIINHNQITVKHAVDC